MCALGIGIGLSPLVRKGTKLNLSAPENLVATKDSDITIILAWDAITIGDGLIIERSEDNITFIEIDRTVTLTSTYQDDTCVGGTKYYYRIAVYKGAIQSDYSNTDDATTDIPAEVSDGNYYAIFNVSNVANVTEAGKMLQLRDLNQNIEGDELLVNGDFSASDGWSLGSGWSIDTGTGKLIAATGTGSANATKAVGLVNGVYRFKYTIDAVTVGAIAEYLPSVSGSRASAGTYDVTKIFNATSLGFRKTAGSTGVLDKAELWRILGNHAVQQNSATAPDVVDDYISFNGTSHYLSMAVNSDFNGADIGTVIAIVQRTGDDDFVLTNDRTGILACGAALCSIGSTTNQSAYYNVKVKAIYWYKGTDANTIRRLNNYYAKLHGVNYYVPTINVQTVAAVATGEHRGFPGMCMVGERLYSLYRKSTGHMSIDGVIASKYSDDYGYTWSDEVIVYDGSEMYVDYAAEFAQYPTAKPDCRDTRCLVTDDGCFFMVGFVHIAYMDNTVWTKVRTICVTHRIPIVNGVVDWASKVKVEIDNSKRWNAFGGGLVKKNGIIYVACYESSPETRLYKSITNGQTWSSPISIDTSSTNECALNFVGNTLYATLRNITPINGTVLRKSTDDGETWGAAITDYCDVSWQGQYAITLTDNNYLVVGRCGGCGFLILNDETTISNLYVLMPLYTQSNYDCGYAHVIYHNGWYMFIWYRSETFFEDAGIYFAKIKGSDLLLLES